MKIVFLGPTLSRERTAELLPGAVVLGPVAQGDIASLCRVKPPEAIGIVDGLFRKSLSVWHKEILFALSLGVRVLGASSMGALRAVECEPWGAEPVGRIARWIRAGAVSDADVAIAHAEADMGWRALSLPMVNVIATLERCKDMADARRREIHEAAAKIFYAERKWPGVAKAAECTKEERQLISANKVDLKALDAEEMLLAMGRGIPAPDPRTPPRHAENIFESYGAVLQGNDVRIACADRVPRRAWEIAQANAWCANQAADRALAVEMARSLGLDKDLPADLSRYLSPEQQRAFDLLPHEAERYMRDELILSRARQWVSATDAGCGDAPRILAYLRSIGIYEHVKTQNLNAESSHALRTDSQ